MKNPKLKNWLILIILFAFFIVIISNIDWWQRALHFLFRDIENVIYPRVPLIAMLGEHLKLVIISSGLTIITGVPLGIWVTRSSMRDFLDIINNLVSIGQTIPPVAVLALAVPVFGFGLIPVVLALFLYGLLPVVRNTIAGIQSIPEFVLDSAYGLGMSKMQALFKIEIPLSARLIMTGIRISVIINIGTAMIGAIIGAGGLGSAVIAGLVQDNVAYIMEGVVPAAFLAILTDRFFSNIESIFVYNQ
ncbi:ABC transporter permease [bacterium]|nr:ABC transporter permease [bacterium]